MDIVLVHPIGKGSCKTPAYSLPDWWGLPEDRNHVCINLEGVKEESSCLTRMELFSCFMHLNLTCVIFWESE